MLNISINLGFGWKPLKMEIPPKRYKSLDEVKARIFSLSREIFQDLNEKEISTATVDISSQKKLLTSFYLYNRKNR